MRADYGQAYRDLYQQHWWWRAREAIILEVLQTEKPPNGWKRILDVGCGDGLFFDQLSKLGEVHGIEATEELVSAAGPHRSLIYVGPFDNTFKPTRLFSLILMLDVLEHMADPVAALRHAWTLLEPGGMLLVTVPAFMLLWTNHDVLNQHFTRYTKASFRHIAQLAAVKIEKERYLFHWLFPVKLAARLLEGLLKSEPLPPRVPGNWLNSRLLRLSRLEYRMFGGSRLPWGTSLMAQARKPGAG